MKRNSPKISELYQSDLDRHLFAPDVRGSRRTTMAPIAGWLPLAIAIAVLTLMRGL
jgi:hypothetical protein